MKSCFACCPPIRPAGYEHIQYKNAIKRLLRENTRTFKDAGSQIVPITGFSCWALGYLDKGCSLVGCLLHPDRNKGEDRRYRVAYGRKCTRETCPEARVFLDLEVWERRFWLALASGLDSFEYSSRELNPLFIIMGWGPELLKRIASEEKGRQFTKEQFFTSYPFFSYCSNPRAWAYPVKKLVDMGGAVMLKNSSFYEEFKILAGRLAENLRDSLKGPPGGPAVHLLGLDRAFLDFLRMWAGIYRIREERAKQLKDITDRSLQGMISRLSL